MIQKTDLRRHWLQVRKSIPLERREGGAFELFSFLQVKLKGNVLSFSSFGTEINTHLLNQQLAELGSLFLPRIAENGLSIHQVNDPKCDLIVSKWKILEPDPDRCPVVDLSTIEIALIPGLAFDSSGYRLGYGRGDYDRLLPQLSCPTVGIAFQEQKADRLPIDPWDRPVQNVIYF